MKNDVRRTALRLRDSLSQLERRSKSEIISKKLASLALYQKSQFPMFYASFKSEVITIPLIHSRLASGLPVILPLTLVGQRRLVPYRITSWETDVKKGAYGIPEPDPSRASLFNPADLDLVIVPGSVFDTHCTRHGYGGGFYDKFLAEDAPQATRIALAFSCQVLEKIHSEPHDQKMDLIITEKETVSCRSTA